MIEVKRVKFASSDGFSLVGKITTPGDGTNRGWAVMAHGILESKDEYGGFYIDIAEALAKHGISSLRFDFRGHGESSGTTMDISVIGDVIDLNAGVGQLPVEPGRQFALIGTSFGAGPSVFFTSEWSRRVSCLALIAPVLDYTRTFLKPTTPWAMQSFTPDALGKLAERGYLLLDGNNRLSPRLIEEFRLLRPFEELSRLSQPTLIIHGDRDSMVPYDVSLDAANKGSHIRLHTLHGADHGFTDSEDDTDKSPQSLNNRKQLVEATAAFVVDHSR